jgi:two-component system, sensor histidine kinase and response regulator
MINTDMRRLQQVLLNLLSNAIKFTNRNGTICIDSSMIKNDKGESTHVQIKVKDNGVGMTRPELKNLFKLFGTMKNTMVSNTKGIGLGLCISRMIVEIFGGSV